MSTVFDVNSIQVDGGPAVSLGQAITTITIQDAMAIPDVSLEALQTVDTLTVEVPGLQGPPGVQNVYAQLANPAVQYGWGPEEAGFIWIEVNV